MLSHFACSTCSLWWTSRTSKCGNVFWKECYTCWKECSTCWKECSTCWKECYTCWKSARYMFGKSEREIYRFRLKVCWRSKSCSVDSILCSSCPTRIALFPTRIAVIALFPTCIALFPTCIALFPTYIALFPNIILRFAREWKCSVYNHGIRYHIIAVLSLSLALWIQFCVAVVQHV